MIYLLNWRLWVLAGVVALIGYTHIAVYEAGQADVQALWNAERLDVSQQSIQALEDANAKTAKAQAQRDSIRKAKNAEIAKLSADLDSANDSLRNRPERASDASLPTDNTTGPASRCTGAGLFQDDARFLIWHATQAKRLVLQLTECQIAHGAAVEATQ